MRVAILNTCVPFVRGGAEYLADSLKCKLEAFGHQALMVKIPFKWYPAQRIIEHMLACLSLRIEGVDRLIALKFPAYLVPHPDKVLWLLHQFRQAYDLWGTPFQDLPDTEEGMQIRDVIRRTDTQTLANVGKIYTISHVTSHRLRAFNGIESEILYHPLFQPEQYHCAEYGDYVFYPSRISGGKRQHLVVESMKYVRSDVKVVIAGIPEAPRDLELMKSTIRNHHLEERVKLHAHFITEEEKVKFFANALGTIYIPYDEDSYGYVTLESYHCAKPVITCSDSGGTHILVKDNLTGLIVPPDPRAIAGALDDLFHDKRKASQMGKAGFSLVQELAINWTNVVEKLTS